MTLAAVGCLSFAQERREVNARHAALVRNGAQFGVGSVARVVG
jgi:hypothetical protein